MIRIYTDGSCKNNIGIGRWGFVVVPNQRPIVSKVIHKTTNNRMELMACIQALLAQPDNSDIVIRTDSRYCILSLKFVRNRTKSVNEHKPNYDLLECLREVIKLHNSVQFVHVKAHSGDHYNELVDKAISIAKVVKKQRKSNKKKKLARKRKGIYNANV